ncbi:MAG: T9SS type A sorting domain-containing protein [Cyclobacteriaceae bacterium]|nr:T9SS type A sorting domain-containing protein [Cyclobacteriaceae bacterium]
MRSGKMFISLLLVMLIINFASGQSQPDGAVYPERTDFSKSVKIFPNPAVEFVHVRIETVDALKMRITLHNIIGNELSIETEVVDAHEVRVRVKDLASGYYLLAVKDEESKFRGAYKFLKR